MTCGSYRPLAHRFDRFSPNSRMAAASGTMHQGRQMLCRHVQREHGGRGGVERCLMDRPRMSLLEGCGCVWLVERASPKSTSLPKRFARSHIGGHGQHDDENTGVPSFRSTKRWGV